MYCIKHIISVVGVINLYCKAQYVLYQHFDIPMRFAFVQIFANFPLLSRHQLLMRQRSCSVNETQYRISYVRLDIFDAQPIHFL
jgi:hypothetical protein